MSSSLVGLHPEHLSGSRNSSSSAVGTNSRISSSTNPVYSANSGRDHRNHPSSSVRRASSRNQANSYSSVERGRRRSRSVEDQQGNGDAGTGSEAETVVESPAKKRIQKSMSSTPTVEGKVVSRNGGDGRKRVRSDLEAGIRARPERESPKRLRRHENSDNDASPPPTRRSTAQRIGSSAVRETKKDNEVFSSDLSSAPSSPRSQNRKLKPSSSARGRDAQLRTIGRPMSNTPASDVEMSDAENTARSTGTGTNTHNNHPRSADVGRSSVGGSADRPRLDRRKSLGESIPDLAPNSSSSRQRDATTSSADDNNKNQEGRSPVKLASRIAKRKPPPLRPQDDKRTGRPARSGSISSRGNSPLSDAHSRLSKPSQVKTPGSPVMAPHRQKKDANGRTVLHKACHKGILSEVEEVYENNKDDIFSKDYAGYLPIHEAALNGHVEVVEFLLNHNSPVDDPAVDGDTPLLDAIENGHLSVVKLLLERGADPRKRNKNGDMAVDLINDDLDNASEIEDALKTAIRQRKAEEGHGRRGSIVESSSSRAQSVTSPVYQSPPPSAPAMQPTRAGRRAKTDNNLLWLEGGGKGGPAKLLEFSKQGDTPKVHWLLEQGVQPDQACLHAAAKGGHVQCVEFLLAFGAKVHEDSRRGKDAEDKDPVLACIGRSEPKVLEVILLSDSCDPTRRVEGKDYIAIAKEREGENWEKEVELLQDAISKHQKNSDPSRTAKKSPSKRSDSPAAKKKRRLSTSSSANIKQRNKATASDADSIIEPATSSAPRRVVRARDETAETTSSPPPTKRRRRLVAGKDLNNTKDVKNEEDSDEEMRSTPPRKVKPVEKKHVLTSSPTSARAEKRVKREEKSEQPAKRDIERSEHVKTASEPGKESLKRKTMEKSKSERHTTDSKQAESGKTKVKKDEKEPVSSESGKKASKPEAKSTDSSAPRIKSENLTPAPENLSTIKEKRKPASNGTSSSKGAAAESSRKRHDDRESSAAESNVEAPVKTKKKPVMETVAEKDLRAEARQKRKAERAVRHANARMAALAEEMKRILEKAAEESAKQREAAEKQREQELAEKRRVAEQERLQREEEERKRIELEKKEAERLAEEARIREEKKRIEALPHSLRVLATKSDNEGWTLDYAEQYLPLKVVLCPLDASTETIMKGPASVEEIKNCEKWVANTQVALFLGLKDLSLAQCKAALHIGH